MKANKGKRVKNRDLKMQGKLKLCGYVFKLQVLLSYAYPVLKLAANFGP